MRYNKIHTLLLVIICTATTSFAQSGYKKITNIKILEQKVKEYSQKVHSIKSDFVQIKHLDALETSIESKGKFWFKKENYLRWEYVDPFEYIIAIKQNKFSIKNEGKVTEYDTENNKVFKEINKLISNSVRGNLLMDKSFTIEAYENSTSYKVKLKPKASEMAKVLSSVEMYFSKKDMGVYKLKMIEHESDYTEIKFTNRKLNEKISADIFNIK